MRYLPLRDILEENGHVNSPIFYLKMDIEGFELDGLPVWLNSGAFKNVQQLGIELHATDDQSTVAKLFASVQELYRQNYSIISSDLNTAMGRVADNGHYQNIEIVFRKQPTTKVYNC
jgi:hypothetical protein